MVVGFVGKTAEIDLTNEEIKISETDVSDAQELIGSKGLGARYLLKNLRKGVDPLSPENIMIFATGPLTGTLVCCNRVTIVTKSPLTHTYLDSYAGGHFGPELKFAGYDMICVKGKARNPTYIWINDDKIELRSAQHLWTRDSVETELLLKKELKDNGFRVASIGPAGEKFVRFACVNFDLYRQAGRGGAGAVMGSKLIKAVAVRGHGSIKLADPNKFLETSDEMHKIMLTDKGAMTFTKYSTSSAIGYANTNAVLPTRNFQEERFEEAEGLSGETQRNEVWVKDTSCFGCPIRCTKLAKNKKGPFKGSMVEGAEYETVALLGSNLEIGDTEAEIYFNELCDRLGLDTISTGNVIGFLMECYERGIVSEKETDGVSARFGNIDAVAKLIEKIANREGIGDILAEGVVFASERIGKGTDDFAVHCKGMELPGWSPRGTPGMMLAYATADRGGCHQRGFPTAGECSGLPSTLGEPLERLTIKGKPEYLIREQNYLSGSYASGACEFIRTIGELARAEGVVKLLHGVAGWNMTPEEFQKAGERIWNLIRLFNIREGFSRSDDDLPPRILEEPIPSGPVKGYKLGRGEFQQMLSNYYTLRGWDMNGNPTTEKLKELNLNQYVKYMN